MLRRIFAFTIVTIAIACGSGASGPDGAPGNYARCAPYNGTKCAGVMYSNYYQCDKQPGSQCVPAPGTSPDPMQTVWCCAFGCVRGDPAHDAQCPMNRALYYCNPDAKVDAAKNGCVAGPSSSQLCC